MKLKDLIKLPEKKDGSSNWCEERATFNKGYNIAREEDGNIEVELDAEKIEKIMVATPYKVLPGFIKMGMDKCLIERIAKAIADKFKEIIKK